jgi:hypothetical protein
VATQLVASRVVFSSTELVKHLSSIIITIRSRRTRWSRYVGSTDGRTNFKAKLYIDGDNIKKYHAQRGYEC